MLDYLNVQFSILRTDVNAMPVITRFVKAINLINDPKAYILLENNILVSTSIDLFLDERKITIGSC